MRELVGKQTDNKHVIGTHSLQWSGVEGGNKTGTKSKQSTVCRPERWSVGYFNLSAKSVVCGIRPLKS